MRGIRCRLYSLALPDVAMPPLSEVRGWVARRMTDLPSEAAEDLLLIVTELVVNAYEHARGPRQLRLERRDHAGEVLVEVDDCAVEPPVLGRSRLGPNRGRGVRIVAGLATRWGVHLRTLDGGKTVWAALSYPQPTNRQPTAAD